MKKIYSWSVSISFCACLLAIGFQTFCPIFPDLTSTEERTRNEYPPITSFGCDHFCLNVEKAFSDRLGFRNFLAALTGRIILAVSKLNFLPEGLRTPKVVIGRRGWLYYDDRFDGTNLSDFTGKVLCTENELSRIRENILEWRRWFNERGIVFFILIVPSKHTVYPEFLPDAIRRNGAKNTRLNQMDRLIEQDPEIRQCVVNPAPALIRAKQGFDFYYKTDTHWNGLGAFVAYTELFKGMGIKPVSAKDVDIGRKPGELKGDLMRMLALSREEEAIALRVRAKPERVGTMIFFHDSNGYPLLQLLTRHFEVISFRKWINEKDLKDAFSKKPSVILLQLSERYLDSLLTPPPWQQNGRTV